MKHLVKAIAEFKIGRHEQESRTYYEGFIAYGRTHKEARERVLAEIRLKRDRLDIVDKFNFVGLTVLPERDLNTLHRRIQSRIRTDWEVKLWTGA